MPASLKLNVVSYLVSQGGGARFTVQLLKALQASGKVENIRIVSHGAALVQYRELFSRYGIRCEFSDIPPVRKWTGIFGGDFQVSHKAVADCDVAWFPWLHSHIVGPEELSRIVGSFHDGISYSEESWVTRYPADARRARDNVRCWTESSATLVFSSRYWLNHLRGEFSCGDERVYVVPAASDHSPVLHAAATAMRPPVSSPYFLCPASFSSHKNHEVLFKAYAGSGLTWPLVLTGLGADFIYHRPLWQRIIRGGFVAFGLRPPTVASILRRGVQRLNVTGLIALGYVDDAEYDGILEKAACVVMPTLSEGGGSFPVEEAVRRGIPVVCSDIPVLREHVARLGAQIAWFHPHDAAQLRDRLRDVAKNQESSQAAAMAQVERLCLRSWSDVATEYISIFRNVAAR